jgi:hypothetical protein
MPWRHKGGEEVQLLLILNLGYSYLTSVLDGGVWSASRPGRALPLSVTIGLEAGLAPEPVWTQALEEKFYAPAGDRTPIVQPLVSHYTAWATADPESDFYS